VVVAGGTSLALDLEHRVTHDIECCIDSAMVIQRLVPVVNPVTKAMCLDMKTGIPRYQFVGHCLKLTVADVGEISFMSAAPILDDPTVTVDIDHRRLQRERPAEVIAKMIYCRGSQLEACDVFDLAATHFVMPGELAIAADSPFMSPEVYARARLRIEARFESFRQEMPREVNPTKTGTEIIGDACTLALAALDSMEHGATLSPHPS
jgi:hypothetical protein